MKIEDMLIMQVDVTGCSILDDDGVLRSTQSPQRFMTGQEVVAAINDLDEYVRALTDRYEYAREKLVERLRQEYEARQ